MIQCNDLVQYFLSFYRLLPRLEQIQRDPVPLSSSSWMTLHLLGTSFGELSIATPRSVKSFCEIWKFSLARVPAGMHLQFQLEFDVVSNLTHLIK